jgi:hypothetical protein
MISIVFRCLFNLEWSGMAVVHLGSTEALSYNQVLTAASMNMTVFWKTEPCSLVGIGRHFRCAYCDGQWWRQ